MIALIGSQVEQGGAHGGGVDFVIDDLWLFCFAFGIVLMQDLLKNFALKVRDTLFLQASKSVEEALGAGLQVTSTIVDVAHHGQTSLVELIKAPEDEDFVCIKSPLLQLAGVWIANGLGTGAIIVNDGFPTNDIGIALSEGRFGSHEEKNSKKGTAVGLHLGDYSAKLHHLTML